MKRTKVDKLGRIVLPIEYRKKLGLKAGSWIDIKLKANEIVIYPVGEICPICGSTKERNSILCVACIEKIKKMK